MVAAITDPVSIKAYFDGVGLPSSAPDIAPARPPPQVEFDYSTQKSLVNFPSQMLYLLYERHKL